MEANLNIGKQYGNYKLLEIFEKQNNLFAKIICQCGSKNVYIRKYKHLINIKSKNCVCKKGNYKNNLTHELFRNIKNKSKKRNLSFDLTEESLNYLIQQNCYYCGAEPQINTQRKYTNDNYFRNSLDRIDSNEGYMLYNVLPCCLNCNRAKSDLKFENFIKYLVQLKNNSKNEIESVYLL